MNKVFFPLFFDIVVDKLQQMMVTSLAGNTGINSRI